MTLVDFFCRSLWLVKYKYIPPLWADGLCAIMTMLHPEIAISRAEKMLEAAATGDFKLWRGPEALARVLTVDHLATNPLSPFAKDKATLEHVEFEGKVFKWLVENFESVFDNPWQYQYLWKAEHEHILEQIRRVEERDGVAVEFFPEHGLSVVTTEGLPLDLIPLCHAAQSFDRVLLVQTFPQGCKYHFLYRPESWYSVLEKRPLRVDLQPAVDILNQLEQTKAATTKVGLWWCNAGANILCHLAFSAGDNTGFLGMENFTPSDENISELCSADVVGQLKATLGLIQAVG